MDGVVTGKVLRCDECGGTLFHEVAQYSTHVFGAREAGPLRLQCAGIVYPLMDQPWPCGTVYELRNDGTGYQKRPHRSRR